MRRTAAGTCAASYLLEAAEVLRVGGLGAVGLVSDDADEGDGAATGR